MSLAGCQINLIDVNFHLQNFLEIFDKKQLNFVLHCNNFYRYVIQIFSVSAQKKCIMNKYISISIPIISIITRTLTLPVFLE